MAIRWQTNWLDLPYGRRPSFRFEPDYELLGTLLSADAQSGDASLRHALDSVLGGEEVTAELTGNVCSVLIGSERIVVLDNLATDGIGKACAVDTEEFDHILGAWEDACRRSGSETEPGT